MYRLPYLLKSFCFICLFVALIFPVTTLSAQQPITQAEIDTLLKPNKQKIKIVHINGGWCRVCWQMLPLIDYLNQYKASHIELTVILTYPRDFNEKHKKLLYWLKSRGIDINYYVMYKKQFQQSDLYDRIPTTYLVNPDHTMYRFVGASDLHKNNILNPIQKDVPKTIEAVDAIYKQRKENSRKIINYDDKEYELNYSEIFTLQGKKGGYNPNIKVYEGDVFHIIAKGKIKLGAIAGYTTPNGLSNGQFKSYNIIESVNHGKLMAFLYDKNWKMVQGFQVGTGSRFKATKSGKLVLEINDKDYQNNQGQFTGEIMRFGLVKE